MSCGMPSPGISPWQEGESCAQRSGVPEVPVSVVVSSGQGSGGNGCPSMDQLKEPGSGVFTSLHHPKTSSSSRLCRWDLAPL